MVIRSSPAARNARAIGSDNSTPLLVSATACKPAIGSERSRRAWATASNNGNKRRLNNGSPPVSRSVCAPRRAATRITRICCSSVSRPGGSSTSGQQYGQARLQRAVSDNRNTPMGRLRRSASGNDVLIPPTLPDLQGNWHSPTPL